MSKYLDALISQRTALIASRDAALAALDELATAAEERGGDVLTFTDEEKADIVRHQATVKDVKRQLDGDDDTESLDARIAELEAEIGRAEFVRKAPAVHIKPENATPIDVRSMNSREVRDTAARIMDDADHVEPEVKEAVQRAIRRSTGEHNGDAVARRLVATESDAYRSAYLKGVTGRSDEMTDQERRALSEVRAMSSTTTAGGFAIPVLIDPTVIITDGTGLTGLLPFMDRESITTDTWKGVSAGHTAWSFDAEAAEVSDDTSTFAQPTIDIHTARGFIPFSIEIEQDYPNFAANMGALLNDGYMDLVAEKLAVGTGSAQPWGLFQTTTTTVDVTTDNTFGAPDIDKVWAALGERFRARSTWFMNVDVENDIRGFGSGTATSRFTVDQTREGISLLNGKPVVLSDWAPTWTGTDAAAILVVGDMSKFKLVQRVGMTVEYVPHLTSTGNNRPSGQRGWFAFARYGSDVTVSGAFRKLKNITT